MSKPVEFGMTPLQMSEKQYLQALLDLGVGEQTARFMLGFRNGTVTGDALIPDPDAQSEEIMVAAPRNQTEQEAFHEDAQFLRARSYVAEVPEEGEDQPSRTTIGGKYTTAGRRR